MRLEVVVFPSPEEVARKSLQYLRGPRVAVSGGTTFADLFRRWLPEVRRRITAGETLRFFPVDERRVPFEDAQSNWKSCYEELLLPAGLAGQKDHHVTDAKSYAALLGREFGGNPVVFDQVFLGMGEDGHTASLFPGSESLKDTRSLALDVIGPKPPPRRVTLGLRPLWDCKTLVAIAMGASKAPMVERLLAGDRELPISLALNGHREPVLLLDRAAAGRA